MGQARNEQVTRSVRIPESDCVRSRTPGLVTRSDGGAEGDASASGIGGSANAADGRASVSREGEGVCPVVSMDAEKSAKGGRRGGRGRRPPRGGGGWFFPIKQPAEFVFSPKRRCRFKVIDCHREGGTDEAGGRVELSGVWGRWGTGGWLPKGDSAARRCGEGRTFRYIEKIGTRERRSRCRSFRSVSFRFASSPFRYVTLRLLGRASLRAI